MLPIPLILIGVSAVTGVGGGVGAAKGISDIFKARGMSKKAQAEILQAEAVFKRAVEALHHRAEAYGASVVDIVSITFTSLIEVIGDEGSVGARRGVKIPVDAKLRPGADGKNTALGAHAAAGLSAAGFSGAGTGMAATSAAMSITAMMGTASTGTAISALNGVAATNATLACLGGGSLTAGGGGMALGSTVLSVLGIGPGLLVGGLAFAGAGAKARTSARKALAQAREDAERILAAATLLRRCIKRIDEVEAVLWALNDRAAQAMEDAEQAKPGSKRHSLAREFCAQLLHAMDRIICTPVMGQGANGAPMLLDDNYRIIIKYRELAEQ